MELAHDTWPLLPEMNRADPSTHQFQYGMADRVHHAPNDPISTLMQDDLNHRTVRQLLHEARAHGLGGAVIKVNAVS
jgi:hypothetical protein